MKERLPDNSGDLQRNRVGEVPPTGNPIGSISFEKTPGPMSDETLKKKARKFLHKRRQMYEQAAENKQDIIAQNTGRGKRIILGVGLAATAAAIGAIVIHEHNKKRNK